MKRSLLFASASLAILAPAPAALVNLLPLQKGTVAVTCYSNSNWAYNPPTDPNGPVLALFNGSAAELASAGTGVGTVSYNWQFSHNETAIQSGTPSPSREWVGRNLGEIFGIALDDAPSPNLYVAATTAYGNATWPIGNGPGTVYRLDGTSGAIKAFPQIPNAGSPAGQAGIGAGLGNLCYHRVGTNEWLYVTNMGDGRIYRLNVATCTLDATPFDHGTQALPNVGLTAIADNPALVFTQPERRPWGIGVHGGRLYYSVFSGVNTSGAIFHQTEVWSLALDGAGNFMPATALREFIVPPLVGPWVNGTLNEGTAPRANAPVSDIEFSDSGSMFLAERYHTALYGFIAGTHATRVLEYTGASTSWATIPASPPPYKWQVGVDNSLGRPIDNSAGGVAPACDGSLWVSGDALHTTLKAYGLQRIKPGGNLGDSPPQLNSQIIDLDGDTVNYDKSLIGDADVFDKCSCFEIVGEPVRCPDPGKPFTYTFKLTNKSTYTGHYLWFNACLPSELGTGAVTTVPQVPGAPAGPWVIPGGPLGPSQMTMVTVELPEVQAGQKVCFRITMLDAHGELCCSDKICVDLPVCDCITVLVKQITCAETPVGPVFTLTMTLRNVSNFPWLHLALLPPSSFSPSAFALSPPVLPGGTRTIVTQVLGKSGDRLCFDISVHDGTLENCCSIPCCITLPDCGGIRPDTCDITAIEPCCPRSDGTPGTFAKITMVLCNNGSLTKTYVVTPAGVSAAGCTKTLTAASFIPATQTVTVPPNTCQAVTFEVACEGFVPGDCAGFVLCAQVEGPAPNTNPKLCCEGRVHAPSAGDPTVEDCHQQPHPVVAGGTTILEWTVLNPSNQPLNQDLRVFTDILDPVGVGAPGTEPMSLVSIPISIEARGTKLLRVEVTVPASSALMPGTAFPISFVADSGRIVLSTLLQIVSTAPSPLAIVDVAFAAPENHALRIRVVSPSARRVKLQRSLDMIVWGDEPCTLPPGSGLRFDSFIGNGLPIDCEVPCDAAEPRVFYRAVLLEP